MSDQRSTIALGYMYGRSDAFKEAGMQDRAEWHEERAVTFSNWFANVDTTT